VSMASATEPQRAAIPASANGEPTRFLSADVGFGAALAIHATVPRSPTPKPGVQFARASRLSGGVGRTKLG
jgi:hypothetical protein